MRIFPIVIVKNRNDGDNADDEEYRTDLCTGHDLRLLKWDTKEHLLYWQSVSEFDDCFAEDEGNEIEKAATHSGELPPFGYLILFSEFELTLSVRDSSAVLCRQEANL